MRYLSSLRLGILAVIVLLASCGGSENEVTAYYVRLVHAIDDAPRLQMNVSGFPLHSSVDYHSATRMGIPVSRGGATEIATIDLKAYVPTGEPIDVDSIADYEFVGNNEYTVTTTGTLANPTTFVTSIPRRTKPVTGSYVEFIHGSATQGLMDVFLTEPGLDLAGVTPYATLNFSESSGSLQIIPDSYQVRVTNSGTTDVIFDTGPLDFVDNAERQMILVDNVGSSDAVLSLVSTYGQASGVMNDVAYGARIRGLNLEVDNGPLDIFAGPAQTPISLGLDYAGLGAYQDIPAGDLDFLVTPTNDIGTPLLETTQTAEVGKEYTFVVGSSVDGLIFVLGADDRRSIITEARIGAIHGIYTGEILNIYLSPELPTTMPPLYGNSVVRNLAYGAVSGFFGKAPGEYYLSITTRPELQGGGEVNLVDPILVQLNGGDNLTILIAQASAAEQVPYQVTLIDESLN